MTPYGNPLTMTNANLVTTKLTYGTVGTATNLYSTQSKIAYGLSEERTFTTEYDFYTGLVTSATDVDNSVTSETEYDPLGRPLKAIAAAGTSLESWVRTEYNDALARVVTKADLETKGDGKNVSISHFDELGRLRLARSIENIATENPYNEEHGVKVQTRYAFDNPSNPASSDGVFSVTSNPYRAVTSAAATNEDSMGWALGYVDKTGTQSESENFSGSAIPAPWGTNTNSTGIVTASTDASRTLVIDQAGKKKISKTNALGQLTDVWEIKASRCKYRRCNLPGRAHGYKRIPNKLSVRYSQLSTSMKN